MWLADDLIVGPFLWKIQRAIDERDGHDGNVGREDADLAVRNLAWPNRCMPRHTARRVGLLRKPVSSMTRTASSSAKLLDDIVAHDIAQASASQSCDQG